MIVRTFRVDFIFTFPFLFLRYLWRTQAGSQMVMADVATDYVVGFGHS
jgi:hypothetical protein